MGIVNFFLFPNFQLLDLTGPLTVFQMAPWFQPGADYSVRYVSARGGPVVSSVGLPVETEPVGALTGTLVVVGGFGVQAAVGQPDVRKAVSALASTASRVASVCTGTFLLAAAGLLNGRRVTTHWRSAAELQARFPSLRVERDRIFVRDGILWTSAGVTAGIDLALALVEEDYSAALAKEIAREMVVYYRRPGGQSQFSSLLEAEGASDRVREVIHYVRAHLTDRLDNETLANVACLSARQFSRVFRSETGETPAKLVERLRAEVARADVETTDDPIEMIALAAGFADPERMRRAFVRCFGTPPQGLRRWAKTKGEPQKA